MSEHYRPFDWKTDIIQQHWRNNDPVYEWSFMTFTCGQRDWCTVWSDLEIGSALRKLPDEELTACLLYQPVLAGLITELADERRVHVEWLKLGLAR
jgi:hypothetical protein